MSKHAADQNHATTIREHQALQAILASDFDSLYPGFGKHRKDDA